MKNILWIGLGVMGFPMAGHVVLKSGFSVTVYNRSPEKAARWCATYPGQSTASLHEAAEKADAVLLCVGDERDVEALTLGFSGLLAHMRPGTLLIDHTTSCADLAARIAQKGAERDIVCLDAPVSGGQSGAETGGLSVMCGGESAEAFERAHPLFSCYARISAYIGAPGSGQIAKMCNQIAIAGVLQGLAEALHFGQRAGIDMAKALRVLQEGAAGSWQMSNRGQSMLEKRFDFGFAVDWMRKDLRLTLEHAQKTGATIELAALVDRFYADVQALGGGRWDTSSLITRLSSLKSLSNE